MVTSQLQELLSQVNAQLGSNMKLDYAPQYGSYVLWAVPREYSFMQTNIRLTRKEMANFLYGILCGIRADRGIIFSVNTF